MITVTFWNFAKRENSTKIPTDAGTDFSCDIKTENTITELSIELNVGSSVHPTYTYCYVSDFSRYYFIKNWKWDKGLWIAECEVDVLASFKTEIGQQSMYVLRSASQMDGHIIDELYPTKTNVSESQVYIENDTTGTYHAERMFYEGVFVLGVMGGDPDGTVPATGNTIYYQMSLDVFYRFVKAIFVSMDGYQDADLLQSIFNSITNPLDYIVSCRWYPYPFRTEVTPVNDLWLGMWHILNIPNFYQIQTATDDSYMSVGWQVTLPKHPLSSSRGAYLNCSEFSDYYLDWGGYLVKLNADYLVDSPKIAIGISADFTSPNGILSVTAFDDTDPLDPKTRPLVMTSFPVGIDIPLKQSATSPSGLLGAIGSAASLGISSAFGNIIGSAIAIGGLIGSASKLNGTVVSQGAMGSGYYYALAPKFLMAVFHDVTDDNNTEFGRPLMTTKTISTLSGYIKCGHNDISIDCLNIEREKIMSYMTDGFFYE